MKTSARIALAACTGVSPLVLIAALWVDHHFRSALIGSPFQWNQTHFSCTGVSWPSLRFGQSHEGLQEWSIAHGIVRLPFVSYTMTYTPDPATAGAPDPRMTLSRSTWCSLFPLQTDVYVYQEHVASVR